MPSETIAKGLKKYGIGSKLRRLRLRKSMGLLELGKHTGLSPALLSKLERDLMHPTLPTLLRISMVFSVGLEYFFNPEPKSVLEIVRKGDRMRFPESPDAATVSYHFESLDFPVPNRVLNSYFAEFESVEPNATKLHAHTSIEILYVLTGKLELRTADQNYELAEGDAVYFDASIPHGYNRLGTKRTTALVVTVESEPG
jgi:transcriptional regulator with XRE-family HTH domain